MVILVNLLVNPTIGPTTRKHCNSISRPTMWPMWRNRGQISSAYVDLLRTGQYEALLHQTNLLTNHLQINLTPPPSVIVRRFNFHSRSQQAGESTADFVLELTLQIRSYAGNMLCDRLICGIKDSKVQLRLLAEPDLTFKKVHRLQKLWIGIQKISQGLQTATIHAVSKAPILRNKPSKPSRPGNNKPAKPCWRCGGKHSPDVCFYKTATCLQKNGAHCYCMPV